MDKPSAAPAPLIVEQGVIALLSEAEINQQVATARRFPRSLKKFKDDTLEMVTLNEEFAAACIYTLPPRKGGDGKSITGPSARFAEVVLSAWGNARAGARVIGEGAEFITAQGAFHDLERNVATTFEVQRRITTKDGNRFGADMVGVTGNAACAIAFRNAVLKGVPKAFWLPLFEAAQKTARGDVKTLEARRTNALAEFKKLGVDAARVCGHLGAAGVQDIGLDELFRLQGILMAIMEGDSTVDDIFGAEPPPKAPKAKTTPPAAKPAATTEGAGSAQQGEAGNQPGGGAATPAPAGQAEGAAPAPAPAPAPEPPASAPGSLLPPEQAQQPHAPPKVSPAVVKALRAALAAAHIHEGTFNRNFDIKTLEELPEASAKAAGVWIRANPGTAPASPEQAP